MSIVPQNGRPSSAPGEVSLRSVVQSLGAEQAHQEHVVWVVSFRTVVRFPDGKSAARLSPSGNVVCVRESGDEHAGSQVKHYGSSSFSPCTAAIEKSWNAPTLRTTHNESPLVMMVLAAREGGA
jgi:hypothetical protein